MNIVVITTDELFYLPVAFQKLLKSPARKFVKRIILLPPAVGNQNWFDIISEQLRFGFLYFLFRGFQYIYFKILAKMGLKMHGRFFTVQSVAEHYAIPVSYLDKINSEQGIRIIKDENPDLLVSVSASQIFKKGVISSAKWGAINIHNSPLPLYQGLMPSFWVLCNGENKTATTVHYIDEHIDTGSIILQQEVVIDKDETLDSLIKKTKVKSIDALLTVLRLFQDHDGNPPVKENSKTEATYYSFPTRDDIKKFKFSGRKLLWKNIY